MFLPFCTFYFIPTCLLACSLVGFHISPDISPSLAHPQRVFKQYIITYHRDICSSKVGRCNDFTSAALSSSGCRSLQLWPQQHQRRQPLLLMASAWQEGLRWLFGCVLLRAGETGWKRRRACQEQQQDSSSSRQSALFSLGSSRICTGTLQPSGSNGFDGWWSKLTLVVEA